jgi:hypothetical protein
MHRSLVLALLLGSLGIYAAPSSAFAYTLRTTKTGAHVRWAEPTITLYVDEALERAYGADRIRGALRMAADAWRGLPGVPDIEISPDGVAEGYVASLPTNGVYLMSPWTFSPGQVAITAVSFTHAGRVVGADILLNGDYTFDLLPEDSKAFATKAHDLGAVLTHELGHVLGLDESGEDEQATMWRYVREGEVHQRTLSADDEAGVIAAYSGKPGWETPRAAAGCGPASVAGHPGSERSEGFASALGILLITLATRLRQRRRACGSSTRAARHRGLGSRVKRRSRRHGSGWEVRRTSAETRG